MGRHGLRPKFVPKTYQSKPIESDPPLSAFRAGVLTVVWYPTTEKRTPNSQRKLAPRTGSGVLPGTFQLFLFRLVWFPRKFEENEILGTRICMLLACFDSTQTKCSLFDVFPCISSSKIVTFDQKIVALEKHVIFPSLQKMWKA